MANPTDQRRHVRMRPTSELPAHAVMRGEGLIHEAVTILDVSVGGMAIMTMGKLQNVKAGDAFRLRLSLATFGDYLVEIEVRWKTQAVTGVEFIHLSAGAAGAVRRYVEELFERGASG